MAPAYSATELFLMNLSISAGWKKRRLPMRTGEIFPSRMSRASVDRLRGTWRSRKSLQEISRGGVSVAENIKAILPWCVGGWPYRFRYPDGPRLRGWSGRRRQLGHWSSLTIERAFTSSSAVLLQMPMSDLTERYLSWFCGLSSRASNRVSSGFSESSRSSINLWVAMVIHK